MTERHLSELLHESTPEPPASIDLAAMAARARSGDPVRERRLVLPVLAAAAAVVLILVTGTALSRLPADPVAPDVAAGSPTPPARTDIRPGPAPTTTPVGTPHAVGVDRVLVAPDDRTLTAVFTGVVSPELNPVCGRDYRMYAVEGSATVGVFVTMIEPVRTGRIQTACSMMPVTRVVSYTLDRPLADRIVVQGGDLTTIPIVRR